MAHPGPPDQRRKVRSRILTPTEWIEGDFRVPVLRTFIDYVSSLHEFEVLTDVVFLGDGHREAFFDLRRDAMLVVLPPPGETDKVEVLPQRKLEAHGVSLLTPWGRAHGTLDIVPTVRISDYFRGRQGHVTLRDVRLVSRRGQPPDDTPPSYPVAVVAVSTIIGVSETAERVATMSR